MHSKRLKYKEYLGKFPNCPPKSYNSFAISLFRWIRASCLENSFIPLNLLKEPPARLLDNTDKMCKGYGLSMFSSHELAYKKYKGLYKKKRGVSHEDYIAEKGDAIAELSISEHDGIYGDLNEKSGHCTFHEYENTVLANSIVNIDKIFDDNGIFIC